MRVYDPVTEWEEMLKNVDNFIESHRIDPYTPEEIEELNTKKEVTATVSSLIAI